MKDFSWLHSIGTLPKVISEAMKYLGIKEIPGKGSNPVIMQMAKTLGLENIYKDDDTAWCGLFAAYVLKMSGKPLRLTGYDLLRAAKYSSFGEAVQPGREQLGDLVVLSRSGGGHVCFFIAATNSGTFYGIGGNQSNAVTIAEFSRHRIVAVRRYYSVAPPASAIKYIVNSSGKLSSNEA